MCFSEERDHDHESGEDITEETESSEDEKTSDKNLDLHLSEYEIKRKKKIAYKKRFEEHCAAITAKKAMVYST